MTGPQHYQEAERLLAHSKNHVDQGNAADDKIAELAAAQAQVHATLALAAATAGSRVTVLNSDYRLDESEQTEGWAGVMAP